MTQAFGLSAEAYKKAELVKTNYQFYAQNFLKIKTKAGQLIPFSFNKPQQYIHDEIEKQRKLTGKVRALVLKGRQEGVTTYVEGRYFHHANFKFGTSIGTLTHLADTTDKLYYIVERFYDNLPNKLKAFLPIQNMRKIKLAGSGSEWDFGTAGSDEIGRGGTLQCFHGSEVAFWPRPQKIRSGVMQAVADIPGTELILESTANGMDPIFYPLYIEAMRGENDYLPIFIPWYWMEEYSKPVDSMFVLTDEEIGLKKSYGITNDQINWRRTKIKELGTVHEFKKEYPFNPIEAFQTSGDSFIPNEAVVFARNKRLERYEYENAPLILGIDCSRIRDRLTFSFRKGRKLLKTIVYDPQKGQIREGVKIIGHFDKLTRGFIEAQTAAYLENYGVDLCMIDITEGYGQAIMEGLHGMSNKFKRIVKGITFHMTADDHIKFANKRAEIWYRMMLWITCEDGEVQIPDDDAIHADLTCMPKPENTVNHRIIMADKDKIKKKYGMSPDIGDSIALTFAFLIPSMQNKNRTGVKKKNESTSSVSTLRRKRTKKHEGWNPGNIFQ